MVEFIRMNRERYGVESICRMLPIAPSTFYETEARRRDPDRMLEDVEFATLDWVSWYNERRLLEPIGYIPPVEFEQVYYRNQTTLAMVAGVN